MNFSFNIIGDQSLSFSPRRANYLLFGNTLLIRLQSPPAKVSTLQKLPRLNWNNVLEHYPRPILNARRRFTLSILFHSKTFSYFNHNDWYKGEHWQRGGQVETQSGNKRRTKSDKKNGWLKSQCNIFRWALSHKKAAVRCAASISATGNCVRAPPSGAARERIGGTSREIPAHLPWQSCDALCRP